MAITYQKKVALMSGVVGVDETDGLLEWLRQAPGRRLDLSACTHLHAATLQVLMATRAGIAAWPNDATLRGWLEPACESTQGE